MKVVGTSDDVVVIKIIMRQPSQWHNIYALGTLIFLKIYSPFLLINLISCFVIYFYV